LGRHPAKAVASVVSLMGEDHNYPGYLVKRSFAIRPACLPGVGDRRPGLSCPRCSSEDHRRGI